MSRVCVLCGANPAAGQAEINGNPYCHDGPSPTCYERASNVVWTEYWCPTSQRWVLCPGPCPDGTPHGPGRPEQYDSQGGGS